MEIRYVNQDGTIFGTTRFLAIGKRQPKIVYGDVAKELRENKGISVEELSKALSVNKNVIEGIEITKKAMSEDVMKRYMDYFNVPKERFFDTDLEVYICNDNGNILKEYENSEECKKAFLNLLKKFTNNKDVIDLDFREEK